MNQDELNNLLKDNPHLKVISDTSNNIPQATSKGKVKSLPVQSSKDTHKPDVGQNKRFGKYNAQRTEYNGIVYASKHESRTAQDLDLQIKAGEIDFYLRQISFPLPGCVYRADFVTFKCSNGFELNMVNYSEWKIKVVESKGYPTPEWKRKLKLFKATYPNLEIKIV